MLWNDLRTLQQDAAPTKGSAKNAANFPESCTDPEWDFYPVFFSNEKVAGLLKVPYWALLGLDTLLCKCGEVIYCCSPCFCPQDAKPGSVSISQSV